MPSISYSKSTRSQYHQRAAALLRFAHKSRLTDVTMADLTAYFRSLTTHAPRTVAGIWHALHAAFMYPTVWPSLSPSFQDAFRREFPGFRPRRLPRTLPGADTSLISPAQAVAWLARVTPSRSRLACHLCFDPGVAAAQVVALRLRDVPHLAVPPELTPLLTAQRLRAKAEGSPWLFFAPSHPTQPLSVTTLYKALQTAKQGLGLPVGNGCRVLRTVGIIRRLQAGMDPNEVQQQAGIVTAQAFLPYLRLAELPDIRC